MQKGLLCCIPLIKSVDSLSVLERRTSYVPPFEIKELPHKPELTKDYRVHSLEKPEKTRFLTLAGVYLFYDYPDSP